MASVYVNDLCAADKRRYMEKIKDFSRKEFENSLDPYQVPENEWIDDVALWPPVEFGCIYSYLIERTGEFTKEKLKAYKSLEAYNYYSR